MPRARRLRAPRIAVAAAALAVALGIVTVVAVSVSRDGRSVAGDGESFATTSPPTTSTTEATGPDEERPRTLRAYPAHRATVGGDGVDVYAWPSPAAPVEHHFGDRTELGVAQTFLIADEHTDGAGEPWYRVLLPVRPNGSKGWVQGSHVTVEGLTQRIVVYLSDFRLELWQYGRLRRTYPIGVGTEETPTPGGEYYVREVIELLRTNSAYGSHALGLNGFSDVLTGWRGGGVLGIHGTNRPDSIGTQASHGCIRMHNEHVAELADLVQRGTPVEVVA